ncbi:MAG: thioesterase [Deltaproteobacteria bacterium HGW-Deltaproteobacteria-14]|jgi:acyl-coenzyme A thioesterase PaaI-like protein|nr:MAG: thioesterase [Deltaproteobacteria bacterium HGW-Deltaproteobacteria-14]
MHPAQRTHFGVDAALVGAVERVADGEATAALVATTEMAADERGLVHGGFTFGLADYAAMVAVNDPHVVLGASSCRFLAPVRVGERMVATARVTAEKGRRRVVAVSVSVGDMVVLDGELTTFVLDGHVLDL